jgi:hypothetical protein
MRTLVDGVERSNPAICQLALVIEGPRTKPVFVAGSDWSSSTIRLAMIVARVSRLPSLEVRKAMGNRPMIATIAKETIAKEKAASTSENPSGSQDVLDLIEHWSW